MTRTSITTKPTLAASGAAQDPGAEDRLTLVAAALAGFVYDWDLVAGRVERPLGLFAQLGYDDEAIRALGADPDWWVAQIHPDDAAHLLPRLERLRDDPAATTSVSEYRVRRRDGSWVWMTDRGRFVRDADGRAVRMVGIVVGLEAQRVAEEAERARLLELERSARMRAEALQRAASALGRSRDTATVARALVEHMMAALGADGGGIMQLSADRDALEIVGAAGYGADVIDRYARVPLTATMPATEVVREEAAQYVGTLDEWVRRYGNEPSALRHGSNRGAWAALPLRADERLIGVLTLAFDAPRAFPDDERAFMQAFADQCAQAFERADAGEAEHAARLAVEHTMRALQDSERALRETQRVARIGSWRWEVATDRLTWDDATCALYGIPPERAPTDYEGYLALVHPDDRVHARTVAERAFASRQPFAFDHRVLLPDGGVRVLHGRGAVHLDAEGRVSGMIGSSQDVTERKRAEAQLARLLESERAARAEAEAARAAAEEARLAAEAANRAKSDFLAVMSHELRTPLNAIQGHVQLLDMGVYGEINHAQRDATQRIDRAQRHLLRLIEGVLNFAKLEAGHVGLHLEPVLVRDVIGDVLPLVEPQLAARGLTLRVQLPDDADVTTSVPVRADREKLGQVLLNLLGNAVKFTPAGGRIDVRLDLGEPDDTHVRLCVADSGVGIPPEKVESIFEPFVQVDSSLTRETGGTGLGLAISRELVRGMGGDIEVESVIGDGSTFVVRLPRA
jgi:PAS domain S-box-containing protein